MSKVIGLKENLNLSTFKKNLVDFGGGSGAGETETDRQNLKILFTKSYSQIDYIN